MQVYMYQIQIYIHIADLLNTRFHCFTGNDEAELSFQHTNDFPLYTEAIKFFNHSESMVRIAVRTLTLNVYRVEEESMLKFVIDKTAVPYFANLVNILGLVREPLWLSENQT
jgi:hypothetical protein